MVIIKTKKCAIWDLIKISFIQEKSTYAKISLK